MSIRTSFGLMRRENKLSQICSLWYKSMCLWAKISWQQPRRVLEDTHTNKTETGRNNYWSRLFVLGAEVNNLLYQDQLWNLRARTVFCKCVFALCYAQVFRKEFQAPCHECYGHHKMIQTAIAGSAVQLFFAFVTLLSQHVASFPAILFALYWELFHIQNKPRKKEWPNYLLPTM